MDASSLSSSNASPASVTSVRAQSRTRWRLRARLAFHRTRHAPVSRAPGAALTGSLCVLAFLVLAFTGPLLTLQYRPDMELAHASVMHVIHRVPFGWFVRGLHATAADALVAFVLLHLTLTWCDLRFRSKRQGLWTSGVVLLGLSVAAVLSGVVLPWDDRALASIRVAASLVDALPWIGKPAAAILLDGPWVTSSTIPRLFALHVGWIPLAMSALLFAHLRRWPAKDVALRFPSHAPYVWLVAINVVVWGGAFAKRAPGPAADLLKPSAGALAPDWFFLPVYQMLRVMPSRMGPMDTVTFVSCCLVFAAVGLFSVPFWDRSDHHVLCHRWFRRTIAAMVWLCFVVLMGWGYAQLL